MMEYKLTTPCANCPFRNDIRPSIKPERVEEICYSNAEFVCHKTTDHDEDGDPIAGKKSQHCAGLLILLEKEEQPHQMMRIAERIGMYDRTKLDMDAPVYDDIESAICAHEEEDAA